MKEVNEESIVSLLLKNSEKKGDSCFTGDSEYAPYFCELARMGVRVSGKEENGCMEVSIDITEFDKKQLEGLEGRSSFKFLFEGDSEEVKSKVKCVLE